MLRHSYANVRAVVFDAVGTLIHPQPAVQSAYGRHGRRFGSRYADEELLPRFRAAFARQERWDAEHGHGRTSAARETSRWRSIVAEVLDDVTDAEGVFDALWRYFGDPAHWRVDEAALSLFERLRRDGVALAVASNFDERLIEVCGRLPPLDACDRVFVSSQLGYHKPAAEFYEAIECALELAADQILLVGDDLENDYRAARRRGWHALWIGAPADRTPGPHGAQAIELTPSSSDTVASLAQVETLLWGTPR